MNSNNTLINSMKTNGESTR